jgi:hypothetical protein
VFPSTTTGKALPKSCWGQTDGVFVGVTVGLAVRVAVPLGTVVCVGLGVEVEVWVGESVSVGVRVGVGLRVAPRQLHTESHAIDAAETQSRLQLASQQSGSIAQTHASQVLSLQPGPPCGSQQARLGVGVAAGLQPQLGSHSATALPTHELSHSVTQQNESKPHTQDWHGTVSHPGPGCTSQQFPPGVGLPLGVPLVAVGVALTTQSQSSAQLLSASSAQNTSHAVPQQKKSS